MFWTILAYLTAGIVLAFTIKGVKAYIVEIKEARKKKVQKSESKNEAKTQP